MMAKLGDVATYINGFAFKPTDWSDEGLPIIRIQDLTGNSYKANRFNGTYLPKYEVNDGDVLISWSASLGVYVWKGEKAVLNQHIFKVVFDKCEVDRSFFVHQVQNILENAADEAHGATMKHLTKPIFDALPFYLPDMATQRKIASVLDEISNLITKRNEQLAKLDELVKSRFIELFGDCKNEVLIGDVISISRGASPRPISAFITDRDDGVNWIKIGDVSENSLYITKTEEKITPEGAKKSRMVHKGDFILSNSMSFGRPYILGINGCVHDGWLIMSDFKETFNELYLYHAIRSEDVQYQFSGKVNGATVKNLNSDLVKNTFIKVPSMELQNQFATFVEQTDKSKLAIHESLAELETLKKALMQKYFG